MSKTIFIVEDERLIAKSLKEPLIERGYITRVIYDGTKAFDEICAGCPDLVLLDLLMPDVDGFTVLRQLQSDERTRDIPVIIITNLQGREEEVKEIKKDTFYFFKGKVSLRQIADKVDVLLS
jgi:two-component system cell cycle response regulator